MHPLVKGAAAAAILSALGGLARQPNPDDAAQSQAPRPAALRALCGPRTVPDGDACIPLPPSTAPLTSAASLEPSAGAHTSPRRGWETYEQIPRRPDRPADAAAYVYPVGSKERPPPVLSGYDLDRPGHDQRHGPAFRETGHGGIDLGADRNTPVMLVALEHQEGEAEVLFAGELFGNTVVTSHAVRETGRLRQYVVVYGHLERTAVAVGARLKSGDVIGLVGDSGSPGLVHLHLEVRRLRDGVALDGASKEPRRFVDQATSVVCDPRNVLTLH